MWRVNRIQMRYFREWPLRFCAEAFGRLSPPWRAVLERLLCSFQCVGEPDTFPDYCGAVDSHLARLFQRQSCVLSGGRERVVRSLPR